MSKDVAPEDNEDFEGSDDEVVCYMSVDGSCSWAGTEYCEFDCGKLG